jgi:hypothetical protein
VLRECCPVARPFGALCVHYRGLSMICVISVGFGDNTGYGESATAMR